MLARLHSVTLEGIEGIVCEVEVDVARGGLEKSIVVGLPEAAVVQEVEVFGVGSLSQAVGFLSGQLLLDTTVTDIDELFGVASHYEGLLTLRHFKRVVSVNSSREITPPNLDTFVLKRSEEVGKNTLNKDIRNIRAFLNWAVKHRFVASGLEVKKVKVPQKPVSALSQHRVRDLLVAASRHPTLHLRILLAVTTGLRRGDIEAIRVGDIHFDRSTIATRNRKAGKAMPERPIPDEIMTELSNYVGTLPDGQERLFTGRLSPKKWEKARKAVGLPEMKFHDLRKTFASLLAQRGVSIAVTQRLLEHSSPQLTNDVYANVDPVLRQAVDLLPVSDWV